ncbi:MAG: DUF539 domain-containing protein [Myxococcota bacterium]
MALFFITLGAMLLAVLAMSVGVMLTGRRLKGSCGGLASAAALARNKAWSPVRAAQNR